MVLKVLIIVLIIILIIVLIYNYYYIILKSYRPHILSQYKEKHGQFEYAIHSVCLWPYKAVLIDIKFVKIYIIIILL